MMISSILYCIRDSVGSTFESRSKRRTRQFVNVRRTFAWFLLYQKHSPISTLLSISTKQTEKWAKANVLFCLVKRKQSVALIVRNVRSNRLAFEVRTNSLIINYEMIRDSAFETMLINLRLAFAALLWVSKLNSIPGVAINFRCRLRFELGKFAAPNVTHFKKGNHGIVELENYICNFLWIYRELGSAEMKLGWRSWLQGDLNVFKYVFPSNAWHFLLSHMGWETNLFVFNFLSILTTNVNVRRFLQQLAIAWTRWRNSTHFGQLKNLIKILDRSEKKLQEL